MTKLQQAKHGGFFLFVNASIARALNWCKGDEIEIKIEGKNKMVLKKRCKND